MSIEAEHKGASPVLTQLTTLDEQIKAAGAPGLRDLLSVVAEQTWGLPRSTFAVPTPKVEEHPAPPPPDPKHGHANAQRK